MGMKPETNPKFLQLFERVAAGELTRAQAADIAFEETGRSRNTFLAWIISSKERKERLKPLRLTVGTNNVHAHKDPKKIQAYADAVSLSLTGKTKISDAARKYNVDYGYLQILVRKAKGTPQQADYRAANDATADTLSRYVR